MAEWRQVRPTFPSTLYESTTPELGNLMRHSFLIWKKIESMISIDDISIQIDISTYPTLMLILLFPTGTKATGLKD